MPAENISVHHKSGTSEIQIPGVSPTTKVVDLTVSQFHELIMQVARELASRPAVTSNSHPSAGVPPEPPGSAAINNLVKVAQRDMLDRIPGVAEQIAKVMGVPPPDMKKIQDAIAEIRRIMADPSVAAAMHDLSGATQQTMLNVVPQIVREASRTALDGGGSPFTKRS